MSDQFGYTPNFNTPPSAPPGLSWSQTWIKALTQPSVQSYEEIASDTPPSNNRAYAWVFVAILISALINALQSAVFPRTVVVQGVPYQQGFSILSVICSPVAGIVGVLGFAIFIAITQAIAGALGGTGSYPRLLYTVAAYSAPFTILTSIIALIPIVNYLNAVLGIYGFVLSIQAVRAVNQFGVGKAILSSCVIWILVAVVFAVVFLAIVGPAISNVYSNMIQGL